MTTPGFHLILFAASFLLSLASGMENYALIFYVRELFGVDKNAVGWIAGAFDLAYLGGILAFLRWKAPHPRRVLWLSAWAMAASIAVYLAFPLWSVTFVFHALFGLAMALFWPRIMGWLSWGVEGKSLTDLEDTDLFEEIKNLIAQKIGSGFEIENIDVQVFGRKKNQCRSFINN
jgi:MFS family permease